ncbi:MAG TPA: tetratricopeptide repeat protein, partial [Candidatus Hydrogenedentes bacterium]|nr:tetratricopeptide repeat protein [Candidatus Hydrogenedentota bacterium]
PLPSKDRKAIDLGVLLLDAYDRAVGWHIWNDKDPNAALDLARIELAYAPDHAPAHANAGQAHVLKGDRVRAIESFQRAIAIDPQKSGACYASLARLFALEGDFQRAAETARQGLRRYPDDPALAPLLIENLARMGDVKGAISAFRSVVTKPKVAEAAYDTLAVTLQANPATGTCCLTPRGSS